MEQVITKEERYQGIDIFRFVSMFMVVILHVLGHGGILSNLSGSKYFIVCFLQSLAIIAVNCFALISGFLNYNKKFSLKRVLNLWLQVFVINAIITIIFVVNKDIKFSFEILLDILFPILRNQYWYFTSYFLIIILIPIFNIIIEKCEKSVILTLLGFLGVLIGLLTFMSRWFTLFDFKSGHTVSWLAYLYLCGGVIHKYNLRIRIFDKCKYCYLILYVILSLMSVVCSLNSFNIFGYHIMEYYTNIFNLINSLVLLMFFANINPKKSSIIAYLSTTSFGVYLIHDNYYIRNYIIAGKFTPMAIYNPLIICLIVLLFSIIIYLVCSIFEYVRRKLFKLLKFEKIVNNINTKFTNNYKIIANSIDKKSKIND